jgi:hypothetical protein
MHLCLFTSPWLRRHSLSIKDRQFDRWDCHTYKMFNTKNCVFDIACTWQYVKKLMSFRLLKTLVWADASNSVNTFGNTRVKLPGRVCVLLLPGFHSYNLVYFHVTLPTCINFLCGGFRKYFSVFFFFMVTPCIYDIKHFNVQLVHTTLKT